MPHRIIYEWCLETYTNDDFKDIVDSQFSDHLDFRKSYFISNEKYASRFVLVRSEGDDINGLYDTLWAYVNDKRLPINFSNEFGHIVDYKVPKKFHKELRYYLNNKNVK